MAPEIFKGKAYNGFKADIWSLGVLLFSMIHAEMPFKGSEVDELK
jgi:serine/threonine protein kinase